VAAGREEAVVWVSLVGGPLGGLHGTEHLGGVGALTDLVVPSAPLSAAAPETLDLTVPLVLSVPGWYESM
jgi:hypothetical protein